MILIVQLMHTNQLLGRHSRSHGLFAGLGRACGGFELGIRMRHGPFPAFVEVAAEGLDLGIGAAVFLDHAVDLL